MHDFSTLVSRLNEELAPFLNAPYAVFGHSMGALLAFEWVRSTRRANLPLPLHIFVSGRCAPDVTSASPILQGLPDNEFLSELQTRYEGIPSEFLLSPELLEYYLPILRADIDIVESYHYSSEPPLNCPLTAFAGLEDPSLTWDQLLGWKRQTSKSFSAQLFPGGHFYPHEQLLATLSTTLTELILHPDERSGR